MLKKNITELSADQTNKIFNGDSIEIMREMPDNSVDLIFADPPYNLQLNDNIYRPDYSDVDSVREDWDKFENYKSYDAFTSNWLKECKRLLKPSGTIWVIGSYHNIFRVGYIMQNMEFWTLNDIIWTKTNPMPHFRGRRFTNAHETIIWAAKDKKSRYKFNYDAMKSLNDDIQMRSDWHIPICNGKERLRDNDGTKLHPTQKPEALIYRIIVSSSDPNAIVLDPFSGSGTTAAVCKKLGRRWIGIERNKDYVRIAEQRLEEIDNPCSSSINIKSTKRDQVRIPFGTLIERGLIEIGEKLYCSKKKTLPLFKLMGHYKLIKLMVQFTKLELIIRGQKVAMDGYIGIFLKTIASIQ